MVWLHECNINYNHLCEAKKCLAILLCIIDYISSQFYLCSMFLLRIHISNVSSNLLTTYNNKIETGHYLIIFFPLWQPKETVWHILYLYFYFNKSLQNKRNSTEFQVVLGKLFLKKKACQKSRFLSLKQPSIWRFSHNFSFSMFIVSHYVDIFFFLTDFRSWQSTLWHLLCVFSLCYFVILGVQFPWISYTFRVLGFYNEATENCWQWMNESINRSISRSINNQYISPWLCRQVLLKNSCSLPDTLSIWICDLLPFPKISTVFVFFLLNLASHDQQIMLSLIYMTKLRPSARNFTFLWISSIFSSFVIVSVKLVYLFLKAFFFTSMLLVLSIITHFLSLQHLILFSLEFKHI